jgi:localization factor PodJL
MTSGAPWSVKGIDPKAREIAKDLARRSGMTLGEWLNQMIRDGQDPAEAVAPAAPQRPLGGPRLLAHRPAAVADTGLERVLEALGALSARLDASEAGQAQIAARFEQAIGEVRADQARVAEQLKTAAPGAGRSPESLRALETALNKVVGHLQQGEARSQTAIGDLRQEMAQEVQRLGEQLNQKVQAVENRSADAIQQVGAEVSRIASGVEHRLRRADDAQAEALEKLGGEIARITERLTERMAAAERRSAQALDDVGEQMARVTDRIHHRQEQTSSELVERMRQSEERTARLLEEARLKIERRLDRAGVEGAEPPPGAAFAARWGAGESLRQPEAEPEIQAESGEETPGVDAGEDTTDHLAAQVSEEPFAAIPSWPAEPDTPKPWAMDEFVPPPALEAAEPLPAGLDAPVWSQEIDEDDAVKPLEIEDASTDVRPLGPLGLLAQVEPEPEDLAFRLEALAPSSASVAADEAGRPSTRQLIAAARAARAAGLISEAAEPEAKPGLFGGLTRKKPRHGGGTMRSVLLTSGAVASIGLAATGYLSMHPEVVGLTDNHASGDGADKPAAKPAAAKPADVQTAVALTPAAPAAAHAQGAVAEPDAETLYKQAVTQIEAGDAAGLEPLRKSANLGYPQAQYRLAVVFEHGTLGVKADPFEAHRWSQRAAAGGYPAAMHNLALDYYSGIGAPKNDVVAAQWFQRAAELGLRDSQYNLARMYLSGVGVHKDLGQAYKWYLIAARAGDTVAESDADKLKPQISAEIRATAERAAAGFRPEPSAAPAIAAVLTPDPAPPRPNPSLALAQRALAKLGYYQGSSTGRASPALRLAISAYQRDQGLSDTGALSPDLMQRFDEALR